MDESGLTRDVDLANMATQAWGARENAHIYGDTRVGCAVLASGGRIFVGCNVEHRFRCHDVHAEVNAISSMVATGDREIVAVVVVAQRERFTPCGSCMDWIFQFAREGCVIAFQGSPGGGIDTYTPAQLMPYYPR